MSTRYEAKNRGGTRYEYEYEQKNGGGTRYEAKKKWWYEVRV